MLPWGRGGVFSALGLGGAGGGFGLLLPGIIGEIWGSHGIWECAPAGDNIGEMPWRAKVLGSGVPRRGSLGGAFQGNARQREGRRGGESPSPGASFPACAPLRRRSRGGGRGPAPRACHRGRRASPPTRGGAVGFQATESLACVLASRKAAGRGGEGQKRGGRLSRPACLSCLGSRGSRPEAHAALPHRPENPIAPLAHIS